MDRDHGAGGLVERAPGHRARRAGRERELIGPAATRPARVVEQGASVVELSQDLGERVLDRLVGADRAPEGVALLRVGNGDVERRFDAADGLSGEQRLGEVPGRFERALWRVEDRGGRVLEGDVRERSGGVVAHDGLDFDAVGGGLDCDAGWLATCALLGIEHRDPHEHIGARCVGDEGELAADAHLLAGCAAAAAGCRLAP